MSKQVFVILAFHAHEPLWELPSHILAGVDDRDMKSAVGSVNWVKKRVTEGRDMYTNLVDFAKRLGVPVALEATNEILVQLAQVVPDTFARLGAAYRAGIVYPIYGNAHHSHVSLLAEAELSDEIRLNQELVHDVLQAPQPKYRGFFPSEDSLDAAKLGGIKTAGIDFVLFPHLDRRKTRFRALGVADTTFAPFVVGDGLIALPRHFPVSQDIWRPITKMVPENLTGQGYLLGEYWVLSEEYRRKRSVSFPISYQEAVAEYRQTLERAIASAPDGGLILYIQDLELMDFGDVALTIMEDAWRQVIASSEAAIRFMNPDDYLDEAVFGPSKKLGRVKFHQISWAPEIRLVLRSDGHYPPLRAGEFAGIDSDREIFRRWPFILWEGGRYITGLCTWLLQSFGFPLAVGETAPRLKEAYSQLASLSGPSRLALHLRFMKRACNWGWQPDESRHKWPYLHAYAIAAELLQALKDRDVAHRVQENLSSPPVQSLTTPRNRPARGHMTSASLPSEDLMLPDNRVARGLVPRRKGGGQAPAPREDEVLLGMIKGLARLPEVIVDTRVEYLRRGLKEQEKVWRLPLDKAFAELDQAMALRNRAVAHLDTMESALRKIWESPDHVQAALALFISELRAHCKAMFLAIDHIQRAWGRAPSVDDMVISMYRYLYDVYPPKLPEILESTLPEAGVSRLPKLQ